MGTNPRGRTELQMPKKWKERDATTTRSPERTMVWTEPPHKSSSSSKAAAAHDHHHHQRKVAVVYYLCRSGNLEHPHFMEVPLSSTEGLFLRDVVNRLNLLRGKGMANMYSWSSKRSYKNGFVWHDLSENDFIYPAHGQEYVLKGSELLETTTFRPTEPPLVSSSSSEEKSTEMRQESEEEDCEFPVVNRRRRNQSWSGIDLHEYKVYKAESISGYSGKASDASTQTDEKRRRRRTIKEEEEEEDDDDDDEEPGEYENHATELSKEEISPPPSSSSPETLESLIKAHRRMVNVLDGGGGVHESAADIRNQKVDNNHPSGRIKASAVVLMQLISCGSMSFKDCSSVTTSSGKEDEGFSLVSHYRSRLPRGGTSTTSNQGGGGGGGGGATELECSIETLGPAGSSFGSGSGSFSRVVQVEDKEYFSGSLIQTTKKDDDFSALKRSSSYNTDRGSKLVLREKEIDGVRARCMPRKPLISKTTTTTTSSIVKKQSSSSSRNSSHGNETVK